MSSLILLSLDISKLVAHSLPLIFTLISLKFATYWLTTDAVLPRYPYVPPPVPPEPKATSNVKLVGAFIPIPVLPYDIKLPDDVKLLPDIVPPDILFVTDKAFVYVVPSTFKLPSGRTNISRPFVWSLRIPKTSVSTLFTDFLIIKSPL